MNIVSDEVRPYYHDRQVGSLDKSSERILTASKSFAFTQWPSTRAYSTPKIHWKTVIEVVQDLSER